MFIVCKSDFERLIKSYPDDWAKYGQFSNPKDAFYLNKVVHPNKAWVYICNYPNFELSDAPVFEKTFFSYKEKLSEKGLAISRSPQHSPRRRWRSRSPRRVAPRSPENPPPIIKRAHSPQSTKHLHSSRTTKRTHSPEQSPQKKYSKSSHKSRSPSPPKKYAKKIDNVNSQLQNLQLQNSQLQHELSCITALNMNLQAQCAYYTQKYEAAVDQQIEDKQTIENQEQELLELRNNNYNLNIEKAHLQERKDYYKKAYLELESQNLTAQFPSQFPSQFLTQVPQKFPGQYPPQFPGQFPGQFPQQFPANLYFPPFHTQQNWPSSQFEPLPLDDQAPKPLRRSIELQSRDQYEDPEQDQ